MSKRFYPTQLHASSSSPWALPVHPSDSSQPPPCSRLFFTLARVASWPLSTRSFTLSHCFYTAGPLEPLNLYKLYIVGPDVIYSVRDYIWFSSFSPWAVRPPQHYLLKLCHDYFRSLCESPRFAVWGDEWSYKSFMSSKFSVRLNQRWRPRSCRE